MKITIVTVCYNAESSIRGTIESVLSQCRELFEYIIVDGSSTDATMKIVDEYRGNIDIVVSEPDKGIYDAMNKGITMAHGDYINFMNAGDYFVNKNVLKDVVTKIGKESPDVMFGDSVCQLDGIYYRVVASPFYAPPYVKHMMGFCHQCCFVKTETARRFKFDLKYQLAADYNMIMNIFRNNGVFRQLDMPVACYDLNGVSSQQKFRHDTEVFSIERPGKFIANYIAVRKRAVSRILKKMIKPLVVIIFPNVMERKRVKSSRMTKININEIFV